jgi:hypothetical protein
MFRRPFSTTARLFRKPRVSPPSQESPDRPPRLSNVPRPVEAPEELKRDTNSSKPEPIKGVWATVKAAHNPRSEQFFFAFLNPKLNSEQRHKQFNLFALAVSVVAFEELYAPWGTGFSPSTSREERFLDLVSTLGRIWTTWLLIDTCRSWRLSPTDLGSLDTTTSDNKAHEWLQECSK